MELIIDLSTRFLLWRIQRTVIIKYEEIDKLEFDKGEGKYVVVYWWWNHNLCVRYVYLLKAGLNMEINRRMEILSCR